MENQTLLITVKAQGNFSGLAERFTDTLHHMRECMYGKPNPVVLQKNTHSQRHSEEMETLTT